MAGRLKSSCFYVVSRRLESFLIGKVFSNYLYLELLDENHTRPADHQGNKIKLAKFGEF
jgi:hypothetical protein